MLNATVGAALEIFSDIHSLLSKPSSCSTTDFVFFRGRSGVLCETLWRSQTLACDDDDLVWRKQPDQNNSVFKSSPNITDNGQEQEEEKGHSASCAKSTTERKTTGHLVRRHRGRGSAARSTTESLLRQRLQRRRWRPSAQPETRSCVKRGLERTRASADRCHLRPGRRLPRLGSTRQGTLLRSCQRWP